MSVTSGGHRVRLIRLGAGRPFLAKESRRQTLASVYKKEWIDAGEIIRFDGWNFRLIQDDSGAFTISNVVGLTPGQDGRLWIHLPELALARYCAGVFARITPNGTSNPNVSAMGRGSQGDLLIRKLEDGALGFHGNKFQVLASAAICRDRL